MAFTENRKNGIVYMTSPGLGTRHAFTTRLGGVSEGIFESLNLSYTRGDEPERVDENYRRLFAALGLEPERCVFTNQVHGAQVRIVSGADAREPGAATAFEADGLVTAERGLALFCFTADCVPVLLCDGAAGVVAAVHCGWRSTVADILGAAVVAMRSLGARPENIHAAIGPAIGRCCFEVGPEVVAASGELLGEDLGLWEREAGTEDRYLLDLKSVNRRRLVQLGLSEGNIDVSDECTSCLGSKYWSHRATNGRRGSQASVIIMDRPERNLTDAR